MNHTHINSPLLQFELYPYIHENYTKSAANKQDNMWKIGRVTNARDNERGGVIPQVKKQWEDTKEEKGRKEAHHALSLFFFPKNEMKRQRTKEEFGEEYVSSGLSLFVEAEKKVSCKCECTFLKQLSIICPIRN